MSAALLGIAGALWCAGAWGQQPAGPQPPLAESDLCTIRGHVLRADTAEPIQGARIAVIPAARGDAGVNYATKTDETGQFVVHRVAPGSYFLDAERDGFTVQASFGAGFPRAGGAITLEHGETSSDIIFRLLPWAVVAGKVTDEDGEPVPGARVEVMRSMYARGQRILRTLGTSTANDLGEYRIWNLPPGRYYVRATFTRRSSLATPADSNTVRGTAPSMAYPPDYYPGTTEPGRAALLELKGGQEMDGIDLGLAAVRAFAVRGRAWDAVRGRPLEGCCVMLRMVDDTGSGVTQGPIRSLATIKGLFELRDVPAGHYELMAQTTAENHPYFARTRVDVSNSDVDGVEVTITRGATVRGTVLIEGNQTVEITGLRMTLRAGGDMPFAGRVYSAQVQADGTFLVEDVPEGAYDVSPIGPHQGTYLKTEMLNGVDLLQNALMLGAGGVKDEMTVVLSARGATVDGTVTDENGQGVPNATVVMAPEGEKRRRQEFYPVGGTDSYGKFWLADLPPGRYKLFSWRKIDGSPWMDPDFLQPLENKGASVSLEENGHSTVELKVLPNPPSDSGPQ